jgi:HK97 family phage major capsid protein
LKLPPGAAVCLIDRADRRQHGDMDITTRYAPGTRATRLLSVEKRAVIDVEARTAELAFSSEEPYERGWGIEILDHAPESIKMDRLTVGGPLLMDHDARDVVGVIEQVSIGADRVARAKVRFGRSARASEIFQDVVDGIRRNVSVGYVIHEAKLESERDGLGTYRVVRWEPFEVSLVAVPADPTVGVGRADQADNSPAPAATSEATKAEETPQTPAATEAVIQEEKTMSESVVADRSADAKTIAAIGAQFKSQGGVELAMEAIQAGKGAEEFRAQLMDKLATQSKPTADVGMTKAETQRYSFLRVLNALANPQDQRAQQAAAFELEASRAAAETSGRAVKGIMVPSDVLRRDLSAGVLAAGGATVSDDLLSADFITLLRNAMVLSGMGTRMMTGLVGNVFIPRHTGAATAYWVAEGNSPTESTQAFDQVPMTPKTVGAFTDISRKLLLQSSLDVEAMVRNDLATVLGLEIERAAINGSGMSNEPRGILQTSQVYTLPLGTDGGAITWDSVVDLETNVAFANAAVGSLNYLTNAKVRGKLKRTFIDGPGTGQRVWQDGNSVNGYNAFVTNAVPSNGTKGTGTALSSVLFGNWNDLLIGMWGGLDLMVDPYTNSTSGTVRVVALQDVDVALRHPESFAVIKDATTA